MFFFEQYKNLLNSSENEKNDKKLLEQLLCPICREIVPFKKMIMTCQHCICHECITIYVEKNSKSTEISCPICKIHFNPSKDIKDNLILNNLIENLFSNCIHPECKWEGRLSEFQKHIENECEKFKTCKYCKTVVQDLDCHIEICEKKPILCTNCKNFIAKDDMKKHITKDCDYIDIECGMNEYGCLWKGTIKEYNHHHKNECMILKLWLENQTLKGKKLSVQESLKNETLISKGIVKKRKPEDRDFLTKKDEEIAREYYKSDFFSLCGLMDKDKERKEKVQKIFKTFDNVHYPDLISFPESTDTITKLNIFAIVSNDIKDLKFSNEENGCQLEISPKEKLMIITMKNMHYRFFIIPSLYYQITIRHTTAGLLFQFLPSSEFSALHSYPIIIASRRWLTMKGGEKIPFMIEPSWLMIERFTLRFTNKENKQIVNAIHENFLDILKKFFDVNVLLENKI